MKKTTLLMIASASLLLANPVIVATPTTPVQPVKPVQVPVPVTVQKSMVILKGQGNGMNMMKSGKCNSMSKKCKTAHKGMNKNKMKNRMNKKSPFLIKHGLPHLTKMIMPYMNDAAFNLTDTQKQELALVRIATMNSIMEAKSQVITLRKEIVEASAAGIPAAQLKEGVAKLALFQAAATMTHLKCIEATKAILTKDQLYFLLTKKNKKMNHGKKMMMNKKINNNQPRIMMMKKTVQQPAAKCASGKCGQGMNK